MGKVRILLCCGAGMSSGFLAQRARGYAQKKGIEVSIEARSQSDIASYMNSIDILMIGPHYASEKQRFVEMTSSNNVPVIVIPQDIYAQLNGEALLELAFAELENK